MTWAFQKKDITSWLFCISL